MNERALKILEFNKIIERLTDMAISPMGKDMASSLVPMEYLSDIKLAQKETTLAAKMALKKGRLPLGGLKDIRPQLKRACVGGVLKVEELLNIGQFLYVTRRVKNYATAENKDDDFGDIGYYFDMVKTVPGYELRSWNSFPSGHTISAFGLFCMMAFFLKKHYLKLLVMVVAVLVAYSRVYLMQHFYVDVYVGSMIGVAMAMATYCILDDAKWVKKLLKEK